MIIEIRGIEIQLLAQKAVFFPKQKVLVLADMHLGKLHHFRRNGIFIPVPSVNNDLTILICLIENFDPEEVVFLGDLFHSEWNSEYHQLVGTVNRYPNIKFTLTKGNHDVIPEELFTGNRIAVAKDFVLENNIILMHQMPSQPSLESFYILGHIHPGYRLQGKGRQTYRLPCFHQTDYSLTLPAFGTHTGLFIPDFLMSDRVYVVMEDEVIQVPR